ncbi:hypothetical protein [Sulfurimonas crateris]|uniref:hypothetical protein n=1 Tax=Sulfurimonas crateris TaxID=2574727 RepID=UPI0014768E53|nr:hypothetical protein [Sulfurimonas crateris]
MDFETLRECVALKDEFKNITEFAKMGVDLTVTSSPYHAKPLDIKVQMRAASKTDNR